MKALGSHQAPVSIFSVAVLNFRKFRWFCLCKRNRNRYNIFPLFHLQHHHRHNHLLFLSLRNWLPTRIRQPSYMFSRKVELQWIIGTLPKTRRQRQQERHQTKVSMSRKMAVHVHYNSWCISLPSSTKQQREMTNFQVFLTTGTTTTNFSYFYLELNVFIAYLAGASFNTDKHTE